MSDDLQGDDERDTDGRGDQRPAGDPDAGEVEVTEILEAEQQKPQKAYREGRTSFYKPISCHLYPVRLEHYKRFTAVNYHRWDVCACAERNGKQLKLPVYKFLKVPLIRKFGEAWYNELEQAAAAYEAEFKR